MDNFKIDKERYVYQIKINNKNYYLDTSDMPGLTNGEKFYSRRLLQEIKYKKKSERRHEVAKIFTEIKSSASFQELFQCSVRKDFKCLDKAYSKDFFEAVASAGYVPICNNGKSCNEKGPPCHESYKGFEDKISKVIYKYMIEVIDDVYNMKIEKYEINKFDSTKKAFHKDIDYPHTEMGEASLYLDFSTGTLIFSGFGDGLIC